MSERHPFGRSVDPAVIVEQRAKGCNVHAWCTDSAEWNLADPGRSAILCPQCFTEAWTAATGKRGFWELRSERAIHQAEDNARLVAEVGEVLGQFVEAMDECLTCIHPDGVGLTRYRAALAGGQSASRHAKALLHKLSGEVDPMPSRRPTKLRHRWLRHWYPTLLERACTLADRIPGIGLERDEDGHRRLRFYRHATYGCRLGIGRYWGVFTFRVRAVDELVTSALCVVADNDRAFFDSDIEDDHRALRRFHEVQGDRLNPNLGELLLAVADVVQFFGSGDEDKCLVRQVRLRMARDTVVGVEVIG